MIFGVFAIGWALVSILEVLEFVGPLDGTTHAVSFVACFGIALLNLIVFNQERA